MKKTFGLNLRRDLRETNAELAKLNRELAEKMIDLSARTGDVQPLLDAVQSLATASSLYTQSTTPVSHGEIQKALGDTLLKIGKAEDNKEALEHAAIAYRGAITVASMLGEAKLRASAKKNYALTLNLLGHRPKRISAISAA